MSSWFKGLKKWLQLLLIIIPFVGWVIDLVIRIEDFVKASKGKKVFKLIVLILFVVVGWAWIWQIFDFIWIIIYGRLTFMD